MIIHDFFAYSVPFKTVGISYAYQEIPIYEVELPNGSVEEFYEADLLHSEEELKRMCDEKNKEMEKDREFWFSIGIPAIRRFERFGF